MKITKENIAIVEGDDCISRFVEESGKLDHDHNMLPLALPHIKEGDVVIDAGAFIGDHTIAYAKQVGESGKVIAFEPNKTAFECLEYNLKGFENVEFRNQGLSDQLGRISLVKIKTNEGMAYSVKLNEKKKEKGIRVITIDSLNLEKVDFIKIDCEGFEQNILKGAIETIKKFRPKMLIEINNELLLRNGTSNNDIYIMLIELGYDYKNIYPGQSLYEEQLDLICIPK